MAETFTENDVLKALEDAVSERGTAKAVAQALGVSDAFICAVRHGKKPISSRLAAFVGFERANLYVARPNTQTEQERP